MNVILRKCCPSVYRHISFQQLRMVAYIGSRDALELDNLLFTEYKYSIDQLMEIAGLCCAQAVYDAYPSPQSSKVLIVCGPGNNGGDGLAAARHLLSFGYCPEIYYPKRPSKPIYEILTTQCSTLEIPFLTSLPPSSDIDKCYHIILDAIFGFSFKGDLRSPFDSVMSTLRDCKIPICSVDVPSGWDVEQGDVNGTGLSPQVLISLTCPKLCAKLFAGRHYLGLRIVPPLLAKRFNIELPQYSGSNQIVQL